MMWFDNLLTSMKSKCSHYFWEHIQDVVVKFFSLKKYTKSELEARINNGLKTGQKISSGQNSH